MNLGLLKRGSSFMGQVPLTGEGAAKFFEFKVRAGTTQGGFNGVIVGYLILVYFKLS